MAVRSIHHNLPGHVSSFIGRERELAAIVRLLGQYRLVTLTGVGGVGKTRLALHAAEAARVQFGDGVWLVQLAPLTAPELVCDTIARVVGAPEGSTLTPLDALASFLSRMHLLLLDNCEHLLNECARVAKSLLSRCPSLTVLATSREPLGIGGEVVLRVPPLRLPDPSDAPAFNRDRLLDYDAVRLFVERTQAAEPSFQLTSVSAPAVVEICHRLDGIPLALELAAVRVRGMGVAYLSARLDDRFRLLTGGDRTGEPRQRTLAALVDWSYGLLAECERVVLRRLSIFRGDFTAEAAEAVCAGDYDGEVGRLDDRAESIVPDLAADDEIHSHGHLPSEAVLVHVTRLVDKSLVQLDHETGRYRLLETIHLYGRQRLAAAGETNVLGRQHFVYFLRLLEDGAKLVGRLGQEAWFARLEQEHDNFRAALDWQLQAGRADEAAQLALGLWPFWRVHTYQREGLRWLEQILALDATISLPADLRPRLFNAMGVLAHMARFFDRAQAYHTEALRLWTASGDQAGIAQALIDIGWQHFQQVELDQAQRCAVESLTLAESSGNQRLIADALLLDAIAAFHADFGLLFGTDAQRDPGPLLRLIPSTEQCLAIWRELGDLGGEASALALLGFVYLGTRQYERAKPLLAESARLHVRLGAYGDITGTLVALMNLAAYTSDAPEGARNAARMFGVSIDLAQKITAEASPWNATQLARRLKERLIGALGQEGFEQALAEGKGLTTAQVLALVDRITAPEPCGDLPQTLPQPRELPMPVRLPLADLTPREREVLHLVVQGLTNAQVAQALIISPRTVNAHLTAIYAKLAVTSRAGAIRYALQHKLG